MFFFLHQLASSKHQHNLTRTHNIQQHVDSVHQHQNNKNIQKITIIKTLCSKGVYIDREREKYWTTARWLKTTKGFSFFFLVQFRPVPSNRWILLPASRKPPSRSGVWSLTETLHETVFKKFKTFYIQRKKRKKPSSSLSSYLTELFSFIYQ